MSIYNNVNLFGVTPPKNSGVIKSTSYSNSEVINNILRLHVPSQQIDLDPTYSKGIFYKKTGIKQPKYKFDIQPQTNDTIQADCRHLPIEDNSINSAMFDPPFGVAYGPSLKNHHKESNIIPGRFSAFKSMQELYQFYYDSLKEFNRILSPRGVLIFKCQDTVSSGTQYMSHVQIYNMALSLGFYPKDLFVLNAKSRIISGKHKNQQHARKFHSYFWVFEKGNPKAGKILELNHIGE